MKVDICVVNFNTQDKLKRLVDALTGDYIPNIWDLYIADNGSTDGSAQWLSQFQGPPPVYITAGDGARRPHLLRANIVWNENFGYSYACNQLAAMGSNEIIGLLNADVWMQSDNVKQIIDAFESDPTMAILGPKQRDETGRITHAGIFGTNVTPKHRGWKELDREDHLYLDKKEAVTVSGSAYFIRRSVWNALTNCKTYRRLYPDADGAFLPTPHYYEETWCSYHARQHGFKVFYDGSISIGHSWHASSPMGGDHDRLFPVSQAIFRTACDAHNIERD